MKKATLPHLCGMTTGLLTLSATVIGLHASQVDISLEMVRIGVMPRNQIQQDVSFSPDHGRIALVASQGSRQMVVVDGHEGPAFSRILPLPYTGAQYRPGKVLFSPDSSSFSYVADPNGQGQAVVTNGNVGPIYDRILWLLYGPDGHRLAYGAAKQPAPSPNDAKQQEEVAVVVDGRPGPAFAQIQGDGSQPHFLFGPDGERFAYVGRRVIKNQYGLPTTNIFHAIVDGEPGPAYDGIGGLRFSPDGRRVAYAAQTGRSRESKIRVVIDGQPGPVYRQILPTGGLGLPTRDAIQFSSDGEHHAYIAGKAGTDHTVSEYVLVVDGIEVASEAVLDHGREAMSQALLSPDGRRWAYVAKEKSDGYNENTYVVVDGIRSVNYASCQGIVFSPNSRRVAYVVTDANRRQVVVVDGRESEPFMQVEFDSLQFSNDSGRFGYLARRQNEWVAVVDGQPGPGHRQILPDSLHFTADGRHFLYTVAGHSSQSGLIAVDHEVYGANLQSGPDGSRRVYVKATNEGSSKRQAVIMLDGQALEPGFAFVDHLTISPDGNRVAAVGISSGPSNQQRARLFVDGQLGPKSWGVQQLVFTPDSRHVITVEDTDRKAGGGSQRRQQVVIDGQPIAEYDLVIMGRTTDPFTQESTVEGGLGFATDGSLRFFATREDTIYLARLATSDLDGLPSLEDTVASTPGPRPLLEFEAHSKEAGDPGNLVIGPDGSLYATSSRGGKYQKGFLFRTDPEGQNLEVLYDFLGNRSDGHRPTALVYGPENKLYGLLGEGGAEGNGSLFRIGIDGRNFEVLHHLDSDSRNSTLISVDADGTVHLLATNDPVRLLRVPPGGGGSMVVYESLSERDRGYLERDRDQLIQDIERQAETLDSFRSNPAQTDPDMVRRYEDALGESQKRLAELTHKLTMKEIGPMVDGGDGAFYGVERNSLFRLEKDSLRHTILHTFEGPPLDGSDARLAPLVTREGTLYGVTSGGGISGGGVIYRINRDGSDYNVLVNSPERVLYIDNPVEAPDGTVLASFRTGLYPVHDYSPDRPPLDPFAGYARAKSLQFHKSHLYGISRQGNGQGQIFRYVLPLAATASGPAVTVTESVREPGPLRIPDDSPEPVSVHFAQIDLPKPDETPPDPAVTNAQSANPWAPSGQDPTSPPASSQNSSEQDAGDPLADVAETAEEAKKTSDDVKETADKVKDTAEKIWKGFGF